MKQIALLATLTAALLAAGENLNGIYLGEDVTAGDPRVIAVQITAEGTVIAFKDQIVPGLHDRFGKPVRIKRVEMR